MREPMRKKRDAIVNENLKQVTEEDKELILNIAFISSLMINDLKDRKKEIEKIIKLANEQGISIANLVDKPHDGNNKETNYSIQDIANKDLVSTISEKDLLDLLVNLASDIEIFDNQSELNDLLDKYRTDISLADNSDISSRQMEMNYTAKDNVYQYNTNNQTRVETFANTAWLANKLAHIFETIQKSNELFVSKKQLDLQKSLMRIKYFCIHRIIEEKQLGADVDLNIFDDLKATKENRFHQIISISLLHYLQPIMLHFPLNELSEEERKLCSDEIHHNIYQEGIGAIFPLKLTPEKEELLSYLMRNVYNNRTNQSLPHIARLKWFFSNNLDRRNIPNKPTTIGKGRKLKGKDDSVKILRENRLFLEKLSKDLGLEFPNYFLEKMLLNSSYSFQEFMNKITPYATEALKTKGIQKEDLDAELGKLFIHIKVLKPMSTLKRERQDSPNLKIAIDDSVQNYGTTFEFLKDNLGNFKDYQSMKTSLNSRIKQKKSTDIEDSRRQEIQDLLAELSEINLQISAKEKELLRLENERTTLKKEIQELADKTENILGKLNERYKE